MIFKLKFRPTTTSTSSTPKPITPKFILSTNPAATTRDTSKITTTQWPWPIDQSPHWLCPSSPSWPKIPPRSAHPPRPTPSTYRWWAPSSPSTSARFCCSFTTSASLWGIIPMMKMIPTCSSRSLSSWSWSWLGTLALLCGFGCWAWVLTASVSTNSNKQSTYFFLIWLHNGWATTTHLWWSFTYSSPSFSSPWSCLFMTWGLSPIISSSTGRNRRICPLSASKWRTTKARYLCGVRYCWSTSYMSSPLIKY